MDTISLIYNSVPPFVWAFIFGTPFIVVFVNVLKKLFGTKSTLVIHSLTATTGFLLTALPELITNNPKPVIFNAAFTTGFFTAANFLYAVTKRLAPFMAAVKAYEAKKEAAKDSTLPAATPASTAATPAAAAPATDPTVFEG